MSQVEKIQLQKIEALLAAAEKLHPTMRNLLFRSFLQGLFMALGSTIGFAIVITIISIILTQLQVFPVINDFLEYWKVNQYLRS